MAPMYCICPHCGFPTVVSKIEHGFSRRCRQCARKFVPQHADATLGPPPRKTGGRAIARHNPVRNGRTARQPQK